MASSLVLNGSQEAGSYVIRNSGFYFLSESLLKPVINVLPSSVVPSRGNVTLVCFSLVKNIICDIQRSSNLDTQIPLTLRKRPPKLHSSWAVPGWFHFHLVGLEESDSGHYVCKCDTDNILLPYSDAILILVTGEKGRPWNDMCQSIRGRKGGREG